MIHSHIYVWSRKARQLRSADSNHFADLFYCSGDWLELLQQSESHLYTGYILDIGSRLRLLEIYFLRTKVRSMASIRWHCKCDRHRWKSESSWQSRISEFRPNSDAFTLQILKWLRKIFSLQLCIFYKACKQASCVYLLTRNFDHLVIPICCDFEASNLHFKQIF